MGSHITEATSGGERLPEDLQEMQLEVVFISPQKACEMLSGHGNYRRLDKKKAMHYAEIMARGEWGVLPPVCVGANGELQDGQHRLRAISICGEGQWLTVVTGAPREEVDHFDNGRLRRPEDTLRNRFGKDLRASPRRLRTIIQATRAGAEKPAALLNCEYPGFYNKYRSAVSRFSGVFPKNKRHTHAMVVAAFCRAWLTVKDPCARDALFEAAIKYSQMQFDSPRMEPLRLLCTWICDQAFRSQASKSDAYLRAANAVKAFLARKPVKRLIPARTDPFPLR